MSMQVGYTFRINLDELGVYRVFALKINDERVNGICGTRLVSGPRTGNIGGRLISLSSRPNMRINPDLDFVLECLPDDGSPVDDNYYRRTHRKLKKEAADRGVVISSLRKVFIDKRPIPVHTAVPELGAFFEEEGKRYFVLYTSNGILVLNYFGTDTESITRSLSVRSDIPFEKFREIVDSVMK